MTVLHHAATHVAAVPFYQQGITMLSAGIASLVSLVIGMGAGWYIKGRGFTGVKTDVSNAVTSVENVAKSA